MGLGSKLKVAVTYNEIIFKDLLDTEEVRDVAKIIAEVLSEDFEVKVFPLKKDLVYFITKLKKFEPAAIFNLCEAFADRSIGEMFVASVYELLEIPYTGSPPLAMGICLNKLLTKKNLTQSGLPTPPGFLLNETEKIKDEMFPLIIKPISEDGSFGISKESIIFERKELESKIEKISKLSPVPMFLEKFIDGRELNVSFLGNEPVCIGEITFQIYPKILTYDGKWKNNSEDDLGTIPKYPAEVEDEVREKIFKIAKDAYNIVGLRDYARIDFRMNEKGEVFIIDINPNPDLSMDAGFARALRAVGINYEDGIKRILQFALERGNVLS